jgi:hypothetical protein
MRNQFNEWVFSQKSGKSCGSFHTTYNIQATTILSSSLLLLLLLLFAMAPARNDQVEEEEEEEDETRSFFNKLFSSCADDPKGSVHRAWGVSLLFLVLYFVLSVIESTYQYIINTLSIHYECMN